MTPAEINELVAKKLGYKKVKGPFGNPMMGTIHKYGWKWPNGKLMEIIPAYSTDISAAWEIVNYLSQTTWMIKRPSVGGKEWHVAFGDQGWSEADTAPMALCLSFLKLNEGDL